VPAAGLAFALLATLAADALPRALWPLSPVEYLLLGTWAGFGFMAGELPNSFLKRQLDIEPGGAAAGWRGVLHFLLDRFDSGFGMLAALALVVHVPWLTWMYVLLLGPFIHWSFSFVILRLGLKGRAA
jgi:hypothetical protein